MKWLELCEERNITGLFIEWRTRQERTRVALQALKLAAEEFELAEALEIAGEETFTKARDKARLDFAEMKKGVTS